MNILGELGLRYFSTKEVARFKLVMNLIFMLFSFQITWLPLLLLLPPLSWAKSALQGVGKQSQCEGGRLAFATPLSDAQLMIFVDNRQSVIINFNVCFRAFAKFLSSEVALGRRDVQENQA